MPLIDHKRSDAPNMDLVQNESAFDRWCSEQAFATHQQHYKTLLEDLATVHAALADRSRLLAMKDKRIAYLEVALASSLEGQGEARRMASDREDEITRLEGALAAALKKLTTEALEAAKGQAYSYQSQQPIADLERRLDGYLSRLSYLESNAASVDSLNGLKTIVKAQGQRIDALADLEDRQRKAYEPPK